EDMLFRLVDGSQENDRSVTRSLAFTDQGGRFETINDGHIHIQNDDCEFLVKQEPQSVDSGLRADQILFKVAQERFQRDKVFDVIIDEQNTDLLFAHAFIL